MPERWGPRRIDEIEKEPAKEAPVHTPGDATGPPTDQPSDDDTTPPETSEALGNVEEVVEKGEYTEVIQDGHGKAVRDNLTGGLYDVDQQDALEKEGAYITAESEAIKDWAAETGDAEKYLEDFESRLYESSDMPSDVADNTPPDIGVGFGDNTGSGPDDSD